MTQLDDVKYDLERNVKDIMVTQIYTYQAYRLEIALEPESFTGPCLCVSFNEFNKIDNVDFNDGCQDAYSTFIDKPDELIKLQLILSIVSKYWKKKRNNHGTKRTI